MGFRWLMNNSGGKSFVPLLGNTLLFIGLVILVSCSVLAFNNHFVLNAHARSGDDNCSSKDSNIIVGTRPFTLGTKCNDVIVACPTTAECNWSRLSMWKW